MEKYLLVSDDSGHRYLIPLSRALDWAKCANLPEEDEDAWDEDAWDAPDFATKIEGEVFTFTNPCLNGVPVAALDSESKRIFITLSVDEHFIKMLKANVQLDSRTRDSDGHVDVRGVLAIVCDAEMRGGHPEQVHARTPIEWRAHIQPMSDMRVVIANGKVV